MVKRTVIVVGKSVANQPSNFVPLRPEIVTRRKSTHPLAEEAIHVVEVHQLCHEVPHRTRLRVRAQNGHLGEAIRQSSFGYWPPLGCIRIEQAFGFAVANHRCEFPAEILSVHQPKAQTLTTKRRVNVCCIARKKYSVLAVGSHQPRVVRPAAAGLKRLHTEVHAGDAA